MVATVAREAFAGVTPFLCGVPVLPSDVGHPDCLLPLLVHACGRARPGSVAYALEAAPVVDVRNGLPGSLLGVRIGSLEIIDSVAFGEAMRAVALGPARTGVGYDADGILQDGVEADLGAAFEEFAATSGFPVEADAVILSLMMRA
jgi:hypothetical protein